MKPSAVTTFFAAPSMAVTSANTMCTFQVEAILE